jgi:hypothetical protein
MLLDDRCLRVLGERCPSTSYEPLLDRHPRQPDSHTVLTRLVITDGCGGSVIFEPAVEHRPRARERVVCESAAAGSFASSSLRRANWAPEEIQRYAWSNQFCTTLASVSSGLKGLFPVSIFIYHAIAVSAYDERLPVSHPPINGCGGQRVVDVDDLAPVTGCTVDSQHDRSRLVSGRNDLKHEVHTAFIDGQITQLQEEHRRIIAQRLA